MYMCFIYIFIIDGLLCPGQHSGRIAAAALWLRPQPEPEFWNRYRGSVARLEAPRLWQNRSPAAEPATHPQNSGCGDPGPLGIFPWDKLWAEP